MKLTCIYCSILLGAMIILNSCGPVTKGQDWDATQSSKNCTVTQGPTSATISCPDGSTATVANGMNGATSPAPVIPPQQVITTVQLCPGTTTYPSVFVEYALCINNQLYGVYSVNGGFLSLLPPGTYSSNAIGSSCSLTIAADCKVIN